MGVAMPQDNNFLSLTISEGEEAKRLSRPFGLLDLSSERLEVRPGRHLQCRPGRTWAGRHRACDPPPPS